MEFAEFVLEQLPPRRRVLEVGCGRKGGVAPALAEAGHDVVAIDPEPPEGPLYRRVTLEEFADPGPFDAVVAGLVLHHVDPLGPALDKLAALAPLLLVDEFAWDNMDEPTGDWYESQYRMLAAAGHQPDQPPKLVEWEAEHADLHRYETLRAEIDARYDELYFEWRPYLYRLLKGPATETLEAGLITAGAIRPIGFRYVGASADVLDQDAMASPTTFVVAHVRQALQQTAALRRSPYCS